MRDGSIVINPIGGRVLLFKPIPEILGGGSPRRPMLKTELLKESPLETRDLIQEALEGSRFPRMFTVEGDPAFSLRPVPQGFGLAESGQVGGMSLYDRPHPLENSSSPIRTERGTPLVVISVEREQCFNNWSRDLRLTDPDTEKRVPVLPPVECRTPTEGGADRRVIFHVAQTHSRLLGVSMCRDISRVLVTTPTRTSIVGAAGVSRGAQETLVDRYGLARRRCSLHVAADPCFGVRVRRRIRSSSSGCLRILCGLSHSCSLLLSLLSSLKRLRESQTFEGGGLTGARGRFARAIYSYATVYETKVVHEPPYTRQKETWSPCKEGNARLSVGFLFQGQRGVLNVPHRKKERRVIVVESRVASVNRMDGMIEP